MHNRNIAPIAMSAFEVPRKSEASQQGEIKFDARKQNALRLAHRCPRHGSRGVVDCRLCCSLGLH
jgi:hypothetical protein